ncbi:MAG TPA: DUF3592 domain-containing protein [Acidimicrobiales bacterium]|nr:DUF3592 domain-containing protein [Acidimicrobiales bacterium]
MTEESYIRGAGAARVDPRRALRVLAVVVVLLLAAITVWQFATTASDRSRAARLRNHGVAVQAAVTSCSGISSGIGMAVQYYVCQGSYQFGGASYTETIRGSRSLLRTGATLEARVVPGDPASLSLPSQAASTGGSWTGPTVLAVVTLAGAAGLIVLWRRRSEPVA